MACYLSLPHHENIRLDSYDESYDAGITNYYWMDIPLGHGVWSYVVQYQSNQPLYTSVYPMNRNIDYAYAMYGVEEVPLPQYDNQRQFTVYIIEESVSAGVEIRGETGTENGKLSVPPQISFVYRPMITLIYHAYRPIMILLLIAIFRWIVLYLGSKETISERLAIFCVICTIIVVNTPLFLNGMVAGHDTIFHMRRIEAIAEGLRDGAFPVKLQTIWYGDYGDPVGVFYGDLLLYIPALLRLLYIPLWKCYQLYMIMTNVMTVAIAYHSFKKITGDHMIAAWGGTLYTLSAWFVVDAYLRNAAGEKTAMMFFFLLAVGLVSLFRDRYKESVVYLVLGYTGLIQTHILSAMMATTFILFICILKFRQVFQKKEISIAAMRSGNCAVCESVFYCSFPGLLSERHSRFRRYYLHA